jgi:hypothetical protein
MSCGRHPHDAPSGDSAGQQAEFVSNRLRRSRRRKVDGLTYKGDGFTLMLWVMP